MADSQRILIVDDNKNNLQVAGTFLREEKFKVSIALDSKAALEIVINNPPDLILLDINMPDVDGFETCKLIKDMPDRKDIPIIFLTAHNEAEYRVSSYESGGVDFISKPFIREEVMARVTTHLRIVDYRNMEQKVKEQTLKIEKACEEIVLEGKLSSLDHLEAIKTSINCLKETFN